MRDKKRARKPINRKTKFQLVYDDESRTEFLTGFHKRKMERKRYHEEKMAEKAREEARELRREKKKVMDESGIKCIFPDESWNDDTAQEEKVHDLPNHTITVTSVTDIDLNVEGESFGLNMVQYESDPEENGDVSDDQSGDDFGFPGSLEENRATIERLERSQQEDQEREAESQKEKVMSKISKVLKRKGFRGKPRAGMSSTRRLHSKRGKGLSTKRKHIRIGKRR